MQTFDFATTCLSLAGVDVDPDHLDGVDLSGFLADPLMTLDPGRLVFSALSAGWPMVRRGPHKYIRSMGWNQEVLFDVERDPEEIWNLTSLDVDREITGALAAAVDGQLAAVRPRLPTFPAR